MKPFHGAFKWVSDTEALGLEASVSDNLENKDLAFHVFE